MDNLSFVSVVVLKKTVCLYYSGDNGVGLESDLSSLSTDAAGQLDVLGHDSDALGVHGTQVRVLKEANVIRFGGLLEGKDGGSLEADLAEV